MDLGISFKFCSTTCRDPRKFSNSAFKLERIAKFSIIRNFKYYQTKIMHGSLSVIITFHVGIKDNTTNKKGVRNQY